MSFFDETSATWWQQEAARVLRIKEELFKTGSRCMWCGCELTFITATIEHLIPRSLGGPTTIENSKLACSSCNKNRGTMSEEEFRATNWLIKKTKQIEATRRNLLKKALKRIAYQERNHESRAQNLSASGDSIVPREDHPVG